MDALKSLGDPVSSEQSKGTADPPIPVEKSQNVGPKVPNPFASADHPNADKYDTAPPPNRPVAPPPGDKDQPNMGQEHPDQAGAAADKEADGQDESVVDKVMNSLPSIFSSTPDTKVHAPGEAPTSIGATDQHKPHHTTLPDLPPAPPSRVIGQGYSVNHPVPTVQSYAQERKAHEKEAKEYHRILELQEKERREEEAARRAESQPAPDAQTDGESEVEDGGVQETAEVGHATGKKRLHHKKNAPQSSKGANEKTEMMDRMNANQQDPITRMRGTGSKNERRVRDPTTGGEVLVKDIDPKQFAQNKIATDPSNVFLHPFPPPRPASLDSLLNKLALLEYGCGAGLFVIWLTVAFGNGFAKFMWRSTICAIIGGGLMTGMSLVSRGLEKEVERVRHDMHRQRGEIFSPPTPESVEWLNGLIKLVWGLINPSMFISVADMIEDVMQQSLPGFVDAVRISDLGQGTNPFRITSMRALADEPGDKGYPKEHWINQGQSDVKSKDTAGKEIGDDQAGSYCNLEVGFTYQALPGQGQSLRAKNIHLLIEFFLGVYDWLHIPIPIWIQVEGVTGVVRLRVQFIPEPPFVRNLTFALCGVPSVEVSAIPMTKMLPNLLDLPFVSYFVKMAIAAGTAELCVPKSMTLNMQEMLGGTAVGDTRAIGVFIVTIHYAEDLKALDNNGKSDPYVVLAYAKFGKPMYSTRIITEDLNPVFEETAVLLLTMDEVKGKEDLAVMLWDSDKASADDLVGRIQVPVAELMEKPNQMIRREDGFAGFEDADDMPGKLHWSIGYFEKAPLVKELEKSPTPEEAKAAAPPSSAPEKEMRPDDAAPNPAKADLPPPPPDVMKTRPDPKWPSGVLSVILHQINNLERQNLDGASGKDREGEAGQDTDEPSEQSNNLPSGYGEIIVNDDMVYKTRVKQYTTNPWFEAGTEVFVRDFTNTVVRVVIRDSRLREADPILGIVNVRLSDVFSEASAVTQMYALTEGVGFGKANISFIFRGMQATLPQNLRGWETGTLEISDTSIEVNADKRDIYSAEATKLRIVTHDSMEVLPKKKAEVQGNTVKWEIDQIRLPVYSRYSSSVVFELGTGMTALKAIGIGGKPDAIAVLWLQDLTDDVEQEVQLPILVGEDMAVLRQNVINDQTIKKHKFEVIGTLTVRLKLDSGLDEDHEKLSLSQGRRHALEAYDHVEGEAKIAERNAHFDDDGVIDKHEKKEIEKARKRQLESRGRGPAQIKAYRSGKWMLRGIKDRLVPGNKTREPKVQTEA